MKAAGIFPHIGLGLYLALGLAAGATGVTGGPTKTEQQLIQMLKSHQYQDVIDALDRLPQWYPDSTNALPYIRQLLRHEGIEGYPAPPALSGNAISRKAARALGSYHADLEPEDFQKISGFLEATDPNVVMDGLKALRGLKAPQAVPRIVRLLKSNNHNILRDACRTLAVLGNRENIPELEPLLKDPRADVRSDAADAIKALQEKSPTKGNPP